MSSNYGTNPLSNLNAKKEKPAFNELDKLGEESSASGSESVQLNEREEELESLRTQLSQLNIAYEEMVEKERSNSATIAALNGLIEDGNAQNVLLQFKILDFKTQEECDKFEIKRLLKAYKEAEEARQQFQEKFENLQMEKAFKWSSHESVLDPLQQENEVPGTTSTTSDTLVGNGHSDETAQSVVTDGPQKFTFKVDIARAGSSIYLTPKSATYLFEPANLDVQFDGNCNEGNLVFNAKKGEFIQGKVQPFVDDVTVIATKKSDPSTILSVGTENSGSFSIGPLENAADYDLEVEKEGYKFIREAGNVYKAVKLSELRVKFIDSVTKEPLGEVLASISGIDNYRSNKVIGASGTQNYIGLRPGEYYIVGHLQEYVFENTPVKTVVKEGEVVTATLEGKRFAYSVFGKLTYLDGQPCPKMRILAFCRDSNLQEDDVTKEDGSYRIRGLKAGCQYKITPKPDNQANLPYPPFVNTIVKKEDCRDVNFMISSADKSKTNTGQPISTETVEDASCAHKRRRKENLQISETDTIIANNVNALRTVVIPKIYQKYDSTLNGIINAFLDFKNIKRIDTASGLALLPYESMFSDDLTKDKFISIINEITNSPSIHEQQNLFNDVCIKRDVFSDGACKLLCAICSDMLLKVELS